MVLKGGGGLMSEFPLYGGNSPPLTGTLLLLQPLLSLSVQGYLAHKKQAPPLGPP